jgi:hypothetical protein
LERVVGLGGLVSYVQASQVEAMAEFAELCPVTGPKDRGFGARGDVSEFVVDELSCALGWTRRMAQVRLELALLLTEILTDTLDAWKGGRLDEVKVRIIADRVAVLSPELARAVQARVLPKIDGLTSGQLRRVVDRAVIEADPAGANARHEKARHERHVEVRPGDDGMSTFEAELSAEDAALAYATLSLIARAVPGTDPRTMNQRRADCLVGLITGRTPAPAISNAEQSGAATTTDAERGKAQVSNYTGSHDLPRSSAAPRPSKPLIHLHVNAGTLLGVDDAPAELAGYGPIPADLARRIAADSTWHRIVTDPATGTILDYGRKTYRPPAALADHVRTRDRVCRFTTCNIPAHRCDVDHKKRWRHGGTTSADNLWTLCRHHHRLKDTQSGWTVTGNPNSIITWTSPTGHQYRSYPHDHRTDDPPPAPPRKANPEPSRIGPPTSPIEPPF